MPAGRQNKIRVRPGAQTRSTIFILAASKHKFLRREVSKCRKWDLLGINIWDGLPNGLCRWRRRRQLPSGKRPSVFPAWSLGHFSRMEIPDFLVKGQVADVHNANGSLVVPGRKHLSGVGPARGKGNIHHTGLDAPANAQRNVSGAQLKAFVYNQPRFVTDDALLHFQFYIFQRLIVEHIDHLLGAAQAGGVGVFCGNADGLRGFWTMTLVALASAAMVLPRAMTPKALASSAGKPPIH